MTKVVLKLLFSLDQVVVIVALVGWRVVEVGLMSMSRFVTAFLDKGVE